MTKYLLVIGLVFLSLGIFAQTPPFERGSTYSTGIFNNEGTSVVAYDRTSQLVFSTNIDQNKLDILNFTDLLKPFRVKQVDLSPYTNQVRAVAASFGLVAVVGEGSSPQSPGKLLFFDKDGTYIKQFSVGALPGMVTFTPLGNVVLVANEGAPNDSYTVDPQGSISVLDISGGIATTTQADMKIVSFHQLDTTAYDPLIHVYGNDTMQPPSQDLEPEYIATDNLGTKAFVALQENNALAIIDIATATLDTVVGLGYKDFGMDGLDASDLASHINIDTYNRLFGMYQPGAIASFAVAGQTYLATANEGEAREYTAYNEVVRMKNIILDVPKFPNEFTLKNDTVLGRLKLTKSLGDANQDFRYENLYTFGGRSFSIWDEQGQLVWDSGDEFEQTLALLNALEFNSSEDDNNSYKSRSDDRGPEPNSIAIGTVDGTTYAFITLQHMGGFMVYDVSNPLSPQFVMYELNRDFSKPVSDPDAGDLGPESIVFVPAVQSFNGVASIFVANEVSGTVTIYQIGTGVGIDEEPSNTENTFFPNPSDGIFHSVEKGNYKVHDSAGKLVKEVKNYNRIDLSEQEDGLYIIRDENGRALRVIKK